MDSPDSVSRVKPPNRTMPKTRPALNKSQTAIGLSDLAFSVNNAVFRVDAHTLDEEIAAAFETWCPFDKKAENPFMDSKTSLRGCRHGALRCKVKHAIEKDLWSLSWQSCKMNNGGHAWPTNPNQGHEEGSSREIPYLASRPWATSFAIHLLVSCYVKPAKRRNRAKEQAAS